MSAMLPYINLIIAFLALMATLAGIFLVPRARDLLRDVSSLKEGQVELKGDIEKVDLKVKHIEGNYKQGINYVSETVERMERANADRMGRLEKSHEAGLEKMESNFTELKTEIRELLQRRRSDD